VDSCACGKEYICSLCRRPFICNKSCNPDENPEKLKHLKEGCGCHCQNCDEMHGSDGTLIGYNSGGCWTKIPKVKLVSPDTSASRYW
jgi:hypothetical protein